MIRAVAKNLSFNETASDMMIISPTQEEDGVLHSVLKDCEGRSELSSGERRFLNSLILRARPRKILEVGVAAGGTSLIILNAIKEIEGARMFAVDYSTDFYRDGTKRSGYAVDSRPDLKELYTLHTGGLACSFMDRIGDGIDFCFIDTMHKLPGEVLDFLMVFPYLKPGCTVVLHDTNLHLWDGRSTATNILLSAMNGEKILEEPGERRRLPEGGGKRAGIAFSNIGGAILDAAMPERLWDIFNLLTLDWTYLPDDAELDQMSRFFSGKYDPFFLDFFADVIRHQRLRYGGQFGFCKRCEFKVRYFKQLALARFGAERKRLKRLEKAGELRKRLYYEETPRS